MSTLKIRMTDLLQRMQSVEKVVVGMTYDAAQELRDVKSTTSEADWTDIGFAFRESEKILNNSKKECARLHEEIGRVLCVMITEKCMSDSTLEIRSKGEFATATPDSKCVPDIPKRDSREYSELLVVLGVNPDHINDDILRPHWKNLQELVTDQVRNGNTTLQKFVGTKTTPKVTFRKRPLKK